VRRQPGVDRQEVHYICRLHGLRLLSHFATATSRRHGRRAATIASHRAMRGMVRRQPGVDRQEVHYICRLHGLRLLSHFATATSRRHGRRTMRGMVCKQQEPERVHVCRLRRVLTLPMIWHRMSSNSVLASAPRWSASTDYQHHGTCVSSALGVQIRAPAPVPAPVPVCACIALGRGPMGGISVQRIGSWFAPWTWCELCRDTGCTRNAAVRCRDAGWNPDASGDHWATTAQCWMLLTAHLECVPDGCLIERRRRATRDECCRNGAPMGSDTYTNTNTNIRIRIRSVCSIRGTHVGAWWMDGATSVTS